MIPIAIVDHLKSYARYSTGTKRPKYYSAGELHCVLVRTG